MATICVVTLEEHQAAIDELRAEFRDLLGAYVTENEQWVSTNRAATLACIAHTTLVMVARASAPGKEEEGRITYYKQGTKSLYSRSSCIDYMRRKKGLPTLRN